MKIKLLIDSNNIKAGTVLEATTNLQTGDYTFAWNPNNPLPTYVTVPANHAVEQAYRTLTKGEIIRQGDEFKPLFGDWKQRQDCVGGQCQVGNAYAPVRRPYFPVYQTPPAGLPPIPDGWVYIGRDGKANMEGEAVGLLKGWIGDTDVWYDLAWVGEPHNSKIHIVAPIGSRIAKLNMVEPLTIDGYPTVSAAEVFAKLVDEGKLAKPVTVSPGGRKVDDPQLNLQIEALGIASFVKPPDIVRKDPDDGRKFRFKLFHTYETQAGDLVRVVGRHLCWGHETVACSDGIYRYDNGKSDTGRVTGTAHDYSCPDNFVRDWVTADSADALTGAVMAIDPAFGKDTIAFWTPAKKAFQTPSQHSRTQANRIIELEAEVSDLRRWKSEVLTVESWWSGVEQFVRYHKDTLVGDCVADQTLVFLKERDKLKKDLAVARDHGPLEKALKDQVETLKRQLEQVDRGRAYAVSQANYYVNQRDELACENSKLKAKLESIKRSLQ